MTSRIALLAPLALLLLAAPVRGQPATGKPELAAGGIVHAAVPDAEPQRQELDRPTEDGEPTVVRVAIYVMDIDQVDSANQTFSASVYVEARWRNPLLRHAGPGHLIRETTCVWTPHLAIVNQQQAWNAFPQFVEISPEGEVRYRQKTWGWFSQPLDLHEFPLDRQVLQIHLAAAGLLPSEVQMVPLALSGDRYSGVAPKFSLPDFSVLGWNVAPTPYRPFEQAAGVPGFMMEIDLARSRSFYFLKVVLPLCLIVVMSWVPRWLNPEEIGTNVGIAATSFLTLVAYLFAITLFLPRVAYLTRMDLFILLSTLMVFLGLVQTVAESSAALGLGSRRLAAVNRWSRMLYPVFLCIVLALSFG